MIITDVLGREILDSRGNPTVEAEIYWGSGLKARASVPSGASTGSLEACELRDADMARFQGRGVLKAVSNINKIVSAALKGINVSSQEQLDKILIELDGTSNKSTLGSNVTLAVSLAFARAQAIENQQPLYQSLNQNEQMVMPVPMMNVLNGGAHADNNVDIQEFMIMPSGAPNFPEAIQFGVEVFYALKSVLKEKHLGTTVGDEGGFAPNLRSNAHALDLLILAIERTGLKPGLDVQLALDVAASELYRDGIYHILSENKSFTSSQMISFYEDLINNYPIYSIEDALDEQDWDGWKTLTSELGTKIQWVGDDLFVTNSAILQKGITEKIANAILIKPNQIGTLTETRKTMRLAKENHYNCILSHRSGETEDTFIADLAVASGCGQIKTGAPCRSDRVAKYNQLLRIYEQTEMPLYKL